MAHAIARLLNSSASDNTLLNELLQDYLDLNDSDDERAETQLDSENDDDDSDPDDEPEQLDMTTTDCDRALQKAPACVDVLSCHDQAEYDQAAAFKCECTHNNGRPCSTLFEPEEMIRRRLDMFSLTPRDQMLVLLGKISCSINLSAMTCMSKKANQKVREHQRTDYWLEGKQLCRKTFKFLHGISQNRLTALLSWYKTEGLVPKEKKSGGRAVNTNSLVVDDVRRVVQFITNYADANALVLPGRVPGFKRDDIKLLPSAHTKVVVYESYKKSLANTAHRVVGESSFSGLWKQLTPYIVTAKPMTDLCWTCQKNNTLIYKGVNIKDSDKSSRLQQQEEHLRIVHAERSLYNTMVDRARTVCRDSEITELQPSSPCSRSISMHYSFDYAQQVHLPSNPLQPGPIYFLVPRKCGLFGVCCEGLPRQVNFLIDEAHLISKGANAVVSYLHFFFERFGLGETDVHLHCDNCSGQNKNRIVLGYCAWRVATGLHKSITLNFLIAGHTKFAPDWCFGLLKQAFRRHAVSSLEEMESVVNKSATANIAQLVGKEDGTSFVPVRDWQAFLDPAFRPLPGMKKYHHFRFDADTPGTVHVKASVEDDEQSFTLFRPNADGLLSRGLPSPLPTPGLDGPRQNYLYRYIREYVDDPWKDVMCPVPGTIFPIVEPVQQPTTPEPKTVHRRASSTTSEDDSSGERQRRGRKRGRGQRQNTKDNDSSDNDNEDVSTVKTGVRGSRGRGRGGRGRGCKK